jgi:hypothetical protein
MKIDLTYNRSWHVTFFLVIEVIKADKPPKNDIKASLGIIKANKPIKNDIKASFGLNQS